MKSHFEQQADTLLVRSTSDIGLAVMKIIESPEWSANELAQIARMAFYHRAQTDLFLKYREKNEEILAIVISTFGSACSPEVIVFFKDGTKINKFTEMDYCNEMLLESAVVDCLIEYEARTSAV